MFFFFFCKTLHFKCIVNIYYALHQTHSGFWHIQNYVYSGISRYLQAHSTLLSHIHAFDALLRHLQSSSGILRTLCKPLVFTNLLFSQALPYVELETYSKPCETSKRDIQNPAMVIIVYSGIIQPYSGICRTLCNFCICSNLTCWLSWNIQNPSIIAYRRIFRTLSDLQK